MRSKASNIDEYAFHANVITVCGSRGMNGETKIFSLSIMYWELKCSVLLICAGLYVIPTKLLYVHTIYS